MQWPPAGASASFNGGAAFRFRPTCWPGSLTLSRTRCGKPSCHCAKGEGHEAWTLTFMSRGKRRVERIPKPWVDQVRQQVEAGRDFQHALREVLTANAELLILARKQESKPRR
ncbi:MAG: DUF6788 family protein [Terriglobales bacterium]